MNAFARNVSPGWTHVGRAVARSCRRLGVVLIVLLSGTALAAAPCGELLSTYLADRDGSTVPCLVDLQENGFCFRLPGSTLDATIRTLDAHLQEQGVLRPEWVTSENGNRTRVPSGNGGSVTIEIVIAYDGPFATSGACRIVPER
ncbi:MAG: hypothetical protein WD336_04230 [Trueperaceae bacterium]